LLFAIQGLHHITAWEASYLLWIALAPMLRDGAVWAPIDRLALASDEWMAGGAPFFDSAYRALTDFRLALGLPVAESGKRKTLTEDELIAEEHALLKPLTLTQLEFVLGDLSPDKRDWFMERHADLYRPLHLHRLEATVTNAKHRRPADEST